MRYSLVVLNGEKAGESIVLDAAVGELQLGRDAACDIAIDDPASSRVHARLSFADGGWRIEDCDSRNGTQVNARFVDRSVLHPGDLIKIGEQMLVFSDEDLQHSGAVQPGHLADDTRVRRVGGAEKHRLANAIEADSTSGSARKLGLLYRLSRDLISLSQQQDLLARTIEIIKEGVATDAVKVSQRGPDGRLLTRFDASPNLDDVDAPQFLANWVADRDEAILLDSDGEEAAGGAIDRGSAIGVPIPDEQKPRGVIECFYPQREQGFTVADLEFVLAVAQQFSFALQHLEYRERIEQTNEHLKAKLDATAARLIGESDCMRQLLDQVSRVAATDSTALVLGESGTGKELVAETLHDMSSRSEGPFIAVNCAAIAESLMESDLFGHEKGAFTGADDRREGQFERAHRGTLFLDEIGELSASCQAKLLRVLETRSFERVGGSEQVQVDVRMIAATHRDLAEMVRQGRFRQDLWYRLRVIELHTPPLRERGEDVIVLAGFFVDRFRSELGRGPQRLSEEAMQLIRHYTWPGNVRELRNAIERAMVLGAGEVVTGYDLGLATAPPQTPGNRDLISLAEAERRHIENVLSAVDHNKAKACRVLEITRATLYNKLNRMSNQS